ncbi:hypothetical protein EMIT0232MI5_160126 [Pseudomonas sp. IT-232MI5]
MRVVFTVQMKPQNGALVTLCAPPWGSVLLIYTHAIEGG